jgi:motility quorum-sensing regulator/GCU-specific mRNA interferase toxin
MDRRTKLKPTYRLEDIQAQMTTIQSMYPTRTAKDGIRALGMGLDDALAVIRGLTAMNFDKSMPCDNDYRIWQDVYFSEWNGIPLYIKFQISGQYFVVSFKESDDS